MESADRLMLDFLAWVGHRRRTYADTMESWRSSCPRLTIWEDAIAAGYIQLASGNTFDGAEVTLTERGRALVTGYGPPSHLRPARQRPADP